jgi:hypothetical protein
MRKEILERDRNSMHASKQKTCCQMVLTDDLAPQASH